MKIKKMVTYYNKKDMTQYAEWVIKSLFPVPENWMVEIKGTDEDFELFTCINNEYLNPSGNVFLHERFNRLSFTPVNELKKHHIDDMKGWCVGLVGENWSVVQKFHLESNNLIYDNRLVELVDVKIVLSHIMGINRLVYSVDTWNENLIVSPTLGSTRKSKKIREAWNNR